MKEERTYSTKEIAEMIGMGMEAVSRRMIKCRLYKRGYYKSAKYTKEDIFKMIEKCYGGNIVDRIKHDYFQEDFIDLKK